MSKANASTQPPFPFLTEGAVEELVDLLDQTHPPVVLAAFQSADPNDAALFFVMCTDIGGALAAHASKIFAMLPFDQQASIAEKVTRTELVDTEHAAQIWNRQIAKIQEALQATTFLGEGTSNLAKLLSHMDVAAQNRLLETLAERQPDAATNVSEKLFTFEDLIDLEDEAIAMLLRVLDGPTLALALDKALDGIRDRFFENMSAAQADAVESESARLTFDRRQLADPARQSVVSLARKFAAKGLLKIG